MPNNADVVVVAARDAWPEYQAYYAYVCQPHRPFRQTVQRMGFYCGGAIQPLVPAIVKWLPSVSFSRSEAHALRARNDARVGDLIDRLLAVGPRTEGTEYGVMLLTEPDDPATLRLEAPIANDNRSSTGRRVAWTRWQRYVSSETLLAGATVTSQLQS